MWTWDWPIELTLYNRHKTSLRFNKMDKVTLDLWRLCKHTEITLGSILNKEHLMAMLTALLDFFDSIKTIIELRKYHLFADLSSFYIIYCSY